MKQQPIKPTIPLAPWFGGKSRIANKLVDRINSIPHSTYVEPFIGMGGVFLRKPFKAKIEIINDLNNDVSNLFKIVKKHPDALIKELEWQLSNANDFYFLRDMPTCYLTDIEKAARFLYLQKLSYGGNVVNRSFTRTAKRSAKFNLNKILPILKAVHERLACVVIDNLSYEDVIKRYDTNTTLFYLDTPYYKREEYYGKGLFNVDDYYKLAKLLAVLQGRFIFSINDHEDIRQIFKDFTIDTMDIDYSVQSGKRKTVTELLISN